MKKQLFLIGILCLVFASCNDKVIDPKEPIEEDTTTYPDCPHYDYEKYYDPVYDRIFSVSSDGKYAVIEKHFDGNSVVTVASRFLLNLRTGEYMLVGGNENGKLGATGSAIEFDTLQFPEYDRMLVFGRFSFCPYNSNIINIVARCDIDTIGDKKNLYSFYNYFTYNIQTMEMEKITPSIFGKWGIRHQTGIQLVCQWLSTSSEGNDKFLIIHPNKITYIYHLQEDRLEETNSIKDLTNTIISGDGQYRFYKSGNGNWKEPYLLYLNDKEVFLEDSLLIKAVGNGSFSKDNKYLAVGVTANNGEYGTPTYLYRNSEIWLMEVDKLMASTGEFTEIRKIKPRTSECHYFTSGCFFTPQNTLIVGLHPYNNSQANIYEMDLKGNILRKITNN